MSASHGLPAEGNTAVLLEALNLHGSERGHVSRWLILTLFFIFSNYLIIFLPTYFY